MPLFGLKESILEETFKFGDTRRTRFLDEFVKKCSELSHYINSNTVIEGNSDKPVFDKDYNIEILNRYAERFGLQFNENIVEY